MICYIHDDFFDKADATWTDFHCLNSIILTNFLTLIEAQHSWFSRWVKQRRLNMALSYYDWCVSKYASNLFWDYKRKQGYS